MTRFHSSPRVLLLLTLAVGCGRGSSYSLAPVSGQVKINGQPVEGAEVHFVGDGLTSVGRTDAEGRYSLPRGAVIGENRVFVSKFTGGLIPSGIDSQDTEQLRMMNASSKTGGGPQQAVAPKFSDPGRSELKFDVPAAGTTTANFEVTGP